MRNTTAILQRELLSLFCSPIAYIVLAGFLLLTGILVLVTGSFAPGQPATLRRVFEFAPYVLAIFLPAITMRSISEEYRSGTIETLMTAPVTDTQVVIGKYLATLIFYLIMVAATGIYLVLLALYGSPDIGASLSSYLGMLLVGAAFLAFGLFASSLTSNQVVAWMVGAVPLMLFVWFAAFLVQQTQGAAREILQKINVLRHLDQFNRGLLTTESATFLVGTCVLFVFLTIKIVESKRWR